MRGVGKVNVAPRDAFPPFPSHYVPCRPHITAMFVKDYWENKPHIMRELRTILSSHSLAVDHQRKVVKRTLGGDVVDRPSPFVETLVSSVGSMWSPTQHSPGQDRPCQRSSTVTRQLEWRCPNLCTWIVDAAVAGLPHISPPQVTRPPSPPQVTRPPVLQPCGGPSSQSDWMLCI